MKKILCFLLAILLLASLSACKSYVDNANPDQLATTGLQALNDSVYYIEIDDSYLDDYFSQPDWVIDAELRMASTASNLNQIGIYHVSDGHAGEMKELIAGYLSKSYQDNSAWYDSYIPKETPKLRDAEVKVFGNYVVYAILAQADRATFFDAIEAELTK